MDRQEPLRVARLLMLEDAASWRKDVLDIDFVEWVRRDAGFDGADVLTNILFKEMCEAGCFGKLDTLSSPPQHKLDQNYRGPFQKLAQAFEHERVKFNSGKLSPKEYLADRLQSAVAEICGWVRDDRLRASGTPVDYGREGRAREIRPSEMSESMTLGQDGLLYQGGNKNGPAWKSVYVSWADFMHCRGETAEDSTTVKTEQAPSVMTAPTEKTETPEQDRERPKPGSLVAGEPSVERVPPVTKAPKRIRASHEQARAKMALDALYPKGIPGPSSVPNDQLLSEVKNWLTSRTPPMKEVKPDSLLRAAGRRKR